MNQPTETAMDRIRTYAEEVARRSGLAGAQQHEARRELESHLFEAARTIAEGEPTLGDAQVAIQELGSDADIEAAFFADLRGPSEPAPWGPRFAAAAIDYGLLFLGIVLLTRLLGLLPGARSGLLPVPYVIMPGANPSFEELANTFLLLALLVGSVSYFALLESHWGATVGKRAMGLRVVTQAGTPPDLWQAFGRNASKAMLPLPSMSPLLLLVDILAPQPWQKDRKGKDRYLAQWTRTKVVIARK